MRLFLITSLALLVFASTASATTTTINGKACAKVQTFKTRPLVGDRNYQLRFYAAGEELIGIGVGIHRIVWSGNGILAQAISVTKTAPATLNVVSTAPKCVGFKLTVSPLG